MSDVIFVPFGQKPSHDIQKLIDERKLVVVGATTGGINPSAKMPKAGTYYGTP